EKPNLLLWLGADGRHQIAIHLARQVLRLVEVDARRAIPTATAGAPCSEPDAAAVVQRDFLGAATPRYLDALLELRVIFENPRQPSEDLARAVEQVRAVDLQ